MSLLLSSVLSAFVSLLREFEVTQTYFHRLATMRLRKAERFGHEDEMENDGEDIDPEDAKTELFRLSMQLANHAGGDQLQAVKARSRGSHYGGGGGGGGGGGKSDGS